MREDASDPWLIDIFLAYQEKLDNLKEGKFQRYWIKAALEEDRERRSRPYNSAAAYDAF